MAASLVGMVARLTIGRKKYAAVEGRMQVVAAQADGLRSALSAAVERDAQAFEGVLAAVRLPKATEAEQAARQVTLEHATLQAAAVPLDVARQAAQVIELAAEVAETGNANAISDALSAAALAHAGLKAAAANVRVNTAGLQDPSAAKPWLVVLGKLEASGSAAERRAQAALAAQVPLPA
jgi:glutamate formiminotransferase/formiminotetrahydrofolate cyclodeaminase